MNRKEEDWLLKEKYNGDKDGEFREDLGRLAADEPLAYIIGHIPFLNCRIYLDSRPLIPRPETEYWVEKAIETIKTSAKPRVLDLCAGSGCIGVSVLKNIKDSTVAFAEIDERHHSTIEKNIDENGIELNRTQILRGDLMANAAGRYDFILSNPPYIDPGLDRTEESVKKFEPALALYGGTDGMEIIKRIITESLPHLAAAGQLWLEHEPEQSASIVKIAQASGFRKAESFPDQYGRCRYSILVN